MSDTDQKERKSRRWVLVEKVIIANGKEGLRFLEIAPELDTIEGGKERIFLARAFKLTYVGNVYTIDASETQCWPDTLRFSGKWHNGQQLAEWQMKARAFDVQRRMIKMAKKAGQPEELREVLEPLRRAHRETDATGRTAIDATVLYFLRRGTTPAPANRD